MTPATTALTRQTDNFDFAQDTLAAGGYEPGAVDDGTSGVFVTQSQLQKAKGVDANTEGADVWAEADTTEPIADGEAAGATLGVRRRNFPHDEATVLELFRRLRGPAETVRGGDRSSLRDRLVLAHTPLVEHCARAFLASGEPTEDLVQEGYIGLIKAVDRFDPDKGVRFSTYACHLIGGEMRHYLRDLGKLIHEPGWHGQLRARVVRETDALTQKLGRAPQTDELAASLSMQPQIVRAVLDTHNVLAVESLDTPIEQAEGGTRTWLEERSPVQGEPHTTQVENHLMLDAAMPRLRDLEQRAIRLFYYHEKSKTEIARELRISVNYASYLVKRGLESLRRIIAESEISSEAVAVYATDGTVPLAQLAAWIETETAKFPSYAVVIFQICNWKAATSRLNEAQRGAALKMAENITRRCARLSDKVVPLMAQEDALCFVALLPNTDRRGRRVAERWADACTSASVSPTNPALVDALLCDYVFASTPADGRGVGDVVQVLADQM